MLRISEMLSCTYFGVNLLNLIFQEVQILFQFVEAFTSEESTGYSSFSKPGGLDLSRRDLDRDLDLDAQKVSVSTVEKISTVFKS
jgi:hypothetical protein